MRQGIFVWEGRRGGRKEGRGGRGGRVQRHHRARGPLGAESGQDLRAARVAKVHGHLRVAALHHIVTADVTGDEADEALVQLPPSPPQPLPASGTSHTPPEALPAPPWATQPRKRRRPRSLLSPEGPPSAPEHRSFGVAAGRRQTGPARPPRRTGPPRPPLASCNSGCRRRWGAAGGGAAGEGSKNVAASPGFPRKIELGFKVLWF